MRLQRRFSPSRYLRRSDGLQRLVQGGAGSEWILARELCAYTTLDGAGVPAGKRRGYTAMAVRRWSPFADPQFHVQWVGQRAMVWAWSAARILEFDSVGRVAAPRRMLPESLYRGQPLAAGEQLVAVDQGLEGRIWREYMLVACHWWPEIPGLEEWNLFRRGAGLPPAASDPEVAEPALAQSPWSGPRTRGLGDVASRYKTLLQAAGVGLAIAMLMVPLAASLRLLVATSMVERQIASQDASLQTILDARENAERDATAVEQLLALRPPSAQISLLANILLLMPGNDWQLLEWQMPDSATLELVVRMANADPRVIVQAWEASGRLGDVTAELGRRPDELTIKARILRAGARAATPAQAASR